jgi:hypothetical protein
MKKIRKGTTNRLNQYKFLLVGILVIAAIAVYGVHLLQGSHAATGATMYVTPATSSITSGSTVSLTIRENSGTANVNSVQSSFTYPSSQLQFMSITEGGAFNTAAATDTSTPGTVRVARFISGGGSVNGDQPIVTVNFKVLATAGTVTTAFDSAFSNVAQTSDGTNILANTSGGSYTIPGASKATMSLSPTSGSFVNGATVSVNIRANGNGASLASVESAIAYPTSQLQYVSTTEGGVYTTAQRTNNANGVVDIIRGIPIGHAGVTGDNPIVTVNFTVIGNSGAAALSFANASGAYDTSGTGTNVLNVTGSTGASYTITSPSPSVSSVAPTSGSTSGGTVVTLTGSNFVNGATVSFGGVAGTAVSVKSATSLVATSPSHAAGVVDVVVNQSGQSAAKAGAFTYNAAACAVPSIPSSLRQTSATSSSVSLAWSASTAGSGCTLAGYNVYRNSVFLTKATGTSFTDSGLAANTHYSYYVVAYDSKNNNSADSSAISAVTNASSVTTPPPVVATTGGGGTTPVTSVSTPTITVTSTGSKSSIVSIAKPQNNQPIPQITGQVSLTPSVAATDTTGVSDDQSGNQSAVVRVDYYLGKKLVATERTAPYTYNFDTTGYTNGVYTVTIKSTYTDGSTKTSTQKLAVKNKFSIKYALVDLSAHKATTAIVLVLIAAVIALIFFQRPLFNRFLARNMMPATSYDSDAGTVIAPNEFGNGSGESNDDVQIITPTQPPSDPIDPVDPTKKP